MAEKVNATGKPATLGADKAYDVTERGEVLRALGVTLHPARNNAHAKTGITIVDDQTAAGEGYGQ
jgi:hypothetical protein